MRSTAVNRISGWVLAVAAMFALSTVERSSAGPGGGKLPNAGIPGNLIAIGTAADMRFDQLRDSISASTLRIKNLSNPTAADVTREVNSGKRAIDLAVRSAARRLDGDVDRRVNLLWLNSSIRWQSILQVDFVRDGLINELHTLATAAKNDLRSYANARKQAARLANNLPGLYDVTIDGKPSAPALARISLQPDFTVVGVIYPDRFRVLAGANANSDLRASFGSPEVIRGMRWYVTKGKLHIVGPHSRASASVGPRTRTFVVTGLDLFPEFAEAVANNTIDDSNLRMVKDGLDRAGDQMKAARLRLTKR